MEIHPDQVVRGVPRTPPSTKGSNPSAPQAPEGDRGFQVIRREAYRLRSGQRGLVYEAHRSLSLCGSSRRPIPGEDPESAWASLTCDEAGRADFGGLTRCASPWACPCCAPRLASARARVLAPQIAARTAVGWSSWLVTLTLRHGRHDALADLLGGLRTGWSRLTSGRWWADLRAEGVPEYVRGLDLTWSDRNGWHPHVHVVLLLPPGHGDGGKAARAFAVRWREVLGRVGFQALPGAQDVQECRDAEAAARYATAPAAVYESVGIATKTGRPGAGATAFDLLRGAVPVGGAPDPACVARWVEYVAATKGRRQTTVSRGLTLNEDAVLLDEEPEAPVDLIALLGPETVSELDRKRRAPELLEAVECAGDDLEARRTVAWAVLGSLRARDWCLPRQGPPEPVRVPEPRPPEDLWTSPETDEGRLWRRMTRGDRARLAQLAT